MENEIFEYIELAIRKNFRIVKIACGISALFVFLVVRLINVPHTAQIKIFANMPSATPATWNFESANGAGALARELGPASNSAFIFGQEALLKSYPIYESVNRKLDRDKIVIPQVKPGLLKTTILTLEKFLFGWDYITSKDKLKDESFSLFQNSTGFESQINEGTFTISYRAQNPEAAILVTRYLADSLIELNIDLANQSSLKLSSFLLSKIKEVRSRLKEESQAIAGFINKNDFTNKPEVMDARYKQYLSALKQLENTQLESETEKILLSETRNLYKSLADQTRNSLVGRTEPTSLDSSLRPAKTTKAEVPLGIDLERLKNRLASELPDQALLSPQSHQQLLTETRKQLNTEFIKSKSIEKQLQAIHKIVKNHEKRIKRYPDLEARLSVLMVEYSQMSKILGALTEQHLKAVIQSDVKVANLFVVDRPRLVAGSILANKPKLLLAGLCIIIIIVSLTISLTHLIRGTVFHKRKLIEPGLPIYLGAVPHIPELLNKNVSNLIKADHRILTLAQSLKRILHNDLKPRTSSVISLTSYRPSAGKSISSLALSYGLSKLGNSVILLNLDFRATAGSVLDYIDECDRKKDNEPEEKVRPPSDVFMRQQPSKGRPIFLNPFKGAISEEELCDYLKHGFSNDLETLKNNFEFVLIDGPPISFSDSVAFVEHSNACVICCPEGEILGNEIREVSNIVYRHRPLEAKTFTLFTNCQLKVNLGSNKVIDYVKYRAKPKSEAA